MTATDVVAVNDGFVEFAVIVISSLPMDWDEAETVRATNLVPPDGRKTLDEFSETRKHPQPLDVCLTSTRLLKPLMLVIVIMEVREDPAGTERDWGLLDIEKPSTRAVTLTDRAIPVPLCPVTVMV